MSDVNSGTATAAYILDITDVERKATQLRTILAGVRNDAVSPAVSPVASTAAPQQTAGINENAAALSRQALAAGDAAGAVELMNQALGKSTEQEKQSTTATEATVRAQASLRVALGDTIGAIELLEAAHAQSVQGSVEEVAIARQLAQIENQGLAATQRAADAEIRLAQERARAAVAVKDYTGALEILNGVQTEGASAQTVAALETQIATTERAGTVTGAFGAELSGLISPLTLATVGLAAGAKAAQSYGDAVHFAGQLQDERTAFGGVIGDFQKGNAILDEATARGRAYGFTQKEITDAFRELAPIIRESTSTTKDQSDALARIAVLKPEAPVQALSTAIEGIQTGNIRALSKELGLTKDEQAQLKHSTDQGTDAFIALNAVLDRHGITLAVARDRMQGQAGAERDATIAAEDLTRAQGAIAAGPGLAFTKLYTVALQGLAFQLGTNATAAQQLNDATGRVPPPPDRGGADLVKLLGITADVTVETNKFSGAVAGVGNDLRRTAAFAVQNATAINDGTVATNNFNAALRAHAAAYAATLSVTQQSVTASLADAESKREVAAKTQLLTGETNNAANAFLALNPQISEGGVNALVTAGKLDPLLAQLIQATLRANEARDALIGFNNAENAKSTDKAVKTERFFGGQGSRGDSSDTLTDSAALVKNLKDQAATANTLIDSEIALAAAKKNTGQQIDLLRQKQAQFAKGTAEYNNIQAQIIGIETSAGKTRVSAAQTTGLQLAQTEETSQAAILKAQREGLERLRDSQEDFDLHRARNQQDEDQKIQSLLAHGQRAQADEERKKFALDQQRNQEDFTIQRQRTLRNNAESTGDIDARTDLRQSQIGQRAALRGVRPTGGGAGIPGTPTFIPDAPVQAQAAPRIIQIFLNSRVDLDGKLVGMQIYEAGLREQIDEDLSIELSSIGITLPPSGGQTAVAGARP